MVSELETISRAELASLRERVRKLAADKSYLELAIGLMNRVSSVAGLENVVQSMLAAVGDVIGGVNLRLYYLIDHDVHTADLSGKGGKVERVEDELVRRAFESHEPVECEHDFRDTKMLTEKFSSAYTWVVPLLVGPDVIGVLKVEGLHIAMKQLSAHLPTFFSHAALVLKNEIQGHTRLKNAHDRLAREVAVRRRAEEELQRINRDLEEGVRQRTAELLAANEQLRRSERNIQVLLEESEASGRALISILEDERHTRTALQASEERFRALFENSPTPIWEEDQSGVRRVLNSLREQGVGDIEVHLSEHPEVVRQCLDLIRVVDVNRATLAMHGAAQKEELLQGWRRTLTPDFCAALQREFTALWSGCTEVQTDSTVQTLTGEQRQVAVHFAVCPGHEESLSKVLVSVTDITERKRAERRTAELAAIVEYSDDAILSKTLDGIITSWNRGAERIYGYTEEEMLGKPVSMLVPEGHRNELPEILERIRSGEHIEHFETVRLRKDGCCFPASLTVSPICDTSGSAVAASTVTRDISDLKRAEADRLAHLHFFESMDAINRAIQGAGDLEQMMSDVLDASLSVFGCDRAWLVYPCDPEAATWGVPMERTRPDCPGVLALGLEIPMAGDIVDVFRAALATAGAVRFDPESGRAVPELPAAQFGVKSQIGMAIFPKVDRPYMFGLHQCSHARVWTPQEERLLEAVGQRLSDALTSLLTQRGLQESHAQLRELGGRLAEVEESERRRLARELHDQVGQSLTAIGMNLHHLKNQLTGNVSAELTERLEDTVEQVEQTGVRIRDVMAELRPAELDDYGLVPALRSSGRKFERRTGIKVDVEGLDLEPRPTPEVENALFRIAQEALTNVSKHARAHTVIMTVEPAGRGVRMTVADDGVGISARGVGDRSQGGGWGMITMRERALAIGGSFRVESKLGQGTEVTVEVPV